MLPLLLLLSLISNTVPQKTSETIVRWGFETQALDAQLKVKGGTAATRPGPRPPEFPKMTAGNLAVGLDSGTFITMDDPGEKSAFDFTNGDSITLEAWVNPQKSPDGLPVYIIGKGRSGDPGYARDNQNWALRLVQTKGTFNLSFLFATKLTDDGQHWHRWTTKDGFAVGSGWHHVAVSYQFGKPESVKGWIDGVPTSGQWDMGGPSTAAPVNDDDTIQIGKSYSGLLDEIAIHRKMLSNEEVRSRFERTGGPRIARLQPELMPNTGELRSDQILFEIIENLPAHDRWLYEGETLQNVSLSWYGESFLIDRLPLQYDNWGIRDAWNAPILLRMTADIRLPEGGQKWLVRTRGLARLWLDGRVICRTKPDTYRPPDGEEPITKLAVPPAPGLRPHGYHQQEVIQEFDLKVQGIGNSQLHRVMLEVIVGGEGHRTESGEVLIAYATGSESYVVPSAGDLSPLALTDQAIEPVLRQIESRIARLDDQRRRNIASHMDSYWQSRHKLARKWTTANAIAVPESRNGLTNPIDRFLDARIETRKKSAQVQDTQASSDFHSKVLPVLRENCFRCHGEKSKGGLKLDSRENAILAGDSATPAVVPGDPEASELIARILSEDETDRMPPGGKPLSPEAKSLLKEWIEKGANWPDPPIDAELLKYADVVKDDVFLRRVFLDTVGVPPPSSEYRTPQINRSEVVDRLLADDRFADHWMPFWLDLLAENPSLLNASLNSTGPFRWFLYDSIRDNKPLDRLITELILMRGGSAEGGSAGFALAGENDAPLAAKGHVLASALMGIELQCARCHDSPYHSTTQKDLYSLAAMLDRKPVKVPETSRVPAAFFEKNRGRESLIKVTLPNGQPVEPLWPFGSMTGIEDNPDLDSRMLNAKDTRERLAILITSPENQRFAPVIVNRVWKRLMGAGFVEPVHDWEGRHASHPELLRWLANELIAHDYDLKHVIRLILTSQVYQRESLGNNLKAPPENRFFQAPDRRRMTAEQIVDSLHWVTGREIDVEELTFVHDGRRPLGARQTLGKPKRSWMFGDLKNERDRPSLSLPKARAVVDVLEVFGWTGARQMPIHEREPEPNVLQPGIMANGTLTFLLTRASRESHLANLACESKSAEDLVDESFLAILGRYPTSKEKSSFVEILSDGFQNRLTVKSGNEIEKNRGHESSLPLVTWFNHLVPEANAIQIEMEKRARQGPPPDERINPSWREAYEDLVWSLINQREFVWIP